MRPAANRIDTAMTDNDLDVRPAAAGKVADRVAAEALRRRTFAVISHPDAGKSTLTEALALHARGVAFVRAQAHWSNKERAFAMTAELMLFQHTCHWYCQSRTVASARLMARHQTRHHQVLAAVSAPTREAYRALTGR